MNDLNLEGIESSYIQNHYGDLFYSLIRIEQPSLVVELGTYLGFSGLHMAAALRDNKHGESELHLIDLWDRYKYRHCSIETTTENFRKNDLLNLENATVRFKNQDAFEISADYEETSIDFLHIDVSNDGGTLERCVESWHPKIRLNGTLVMEGGSAERDQIDWMVKFSKKPIESFLTSSWFKEHFQATTVQPFPSLTLARRVK